MNSAFFCMLGRWPALALGLLMVSRVAAGTTDGPLRIEVIRAHNFVVDSNIETPAGRSPSAAHLGVKVFNDGPTPITDVCIRIGDLTDPTASTGTPGIFPPRTVTVGGSGGYSGTFALQMPGGPSDAVRCIASIEPGGHCVQYFFVTYPLKDAAGNSVAGAAPDPGDDLWLNYDIWASAQDGAAARRVESTMRVTMRNEISAMANKIWPNTSSKVPSQYLDAIELSLGWRPDVNNPRLGSAVHLEGIWYDLGNVGAGFDNDGDGLPDRNAWLQPAGDPSVYDPRCSRLAKCYGLVVVKLNDGTEKLIPFEDQLYFEHLPENNTGAVGLVFYEFIALASGCHAQLTPYQEVASGHDNEKFNADYGTSGGAFAASPPDVVFDKAGPASVAPGATATYTLTSVNTGASAIGNPALSLPFVFEDPIPAGLVYIAGSATASNILPAGVSAAVSWSTDNGLTWTSAEPPAGLVTRIRWALDAPLAAGATATAGFEALVPPSYPSVRIDNTGYIKLGSIGQLATDTATSVVTGINSLGDLVWKDDDRDGIKDAGESGIANITVRLYADLNGDGLQDATDPLYSTAQTNGSGIYSFAALPDGKFIAVVDTDDPDLPAGFTLPNSAPAAISVDIDSIHASNSPIATLTADWPFIGALEVVKTVSPAAYGAGDMITYAIDLENHTAPVPAKATPVQTSWSATVTGNRAGQNPANAQDSPDSVYARIDWTAAADRLTNSGLSYPDPAGVITKVELVLNCYLTQPLVDDRLDVSIDGTLFTVLTTAQLNTLAGPPAIFAIDITSKNPVWTWPLAQSLTANLAANKSSAGDPGTLWVDSIGFRVSTVAVPPSPGTYGPTTIDPLPLTDTFDPAKLQYVSATPPPDSVSGGTITWNNAGPLNAGTRKTIEVVFQALTPPDVNGNGEPDATTTLNTATSSGARFVSGRPANGDNGGALVTINPRGSIGDTVFWDLNANGIRDVNEPGLANVLVTLSNGAQTRTGAGGSYLFDHLVDGTYDVTIVTSTLPWTAFTQTKDPDATVNNASTVTINNNDGISTNNSYPDRDFGYDSALNLITGTIFQDDNGNGVQDGGENPLAGITVSLSGASIATTTSNNSGYYGFGSLANGTFTVTVTQPPASTQTLDPDATVNNATTVVASGGNLYANRDFAYKPAGVLMLGDTVYIDWNGNAVQDSGEEGIAGVDVRLYEDANGDGAIDVSTDALIATAATNAGGVYGFTGLVAAHYIVVVDAADPQFPAGMLPTQDFDGTRDSRGVLNLTASIGAVDFGYQPQGTGSIGDFVFIDADGNGFVSAGETGIPNVPVILYEDTDNNGLVDPAINAIVATATTDVSGGYLFTRVPAGNYVVVVDQTDVAIPVDVWGYRYRLTTPDPHQMTLANGQNYREADFGFAGAGSIGDMVFFDANGNGTQDFGESGIPNVTVELYLDANEDGQPDSGSPLASVVTATGGGAAPAGSYRFTGLEARVYFVKVVTATLPQSGGMPISLTSDPDRDGIPVNDNSYPQLPAGDHADSLAAVAPGANYSGADFGYQPSGAIGDFVWLDLDHDGAQDEGEPGIAGVSIDITNGMSTWSATTDFDGRWSAANLPDGAWTVRTAASNFAPGGPLEAKVATSDADGGGDSTISLTLTNGAVNLAAGNDGIDFGYALNGSRSISGTVIIHDTGVSGSADDIDDFIDDGSDHDAGPLDETELGGVPVYLYAASGGFLGNTMTGGDGNYSFSGLPAGNYRVIIGTTAPPLDRATLTTTSANNPAVISVDASSGSSVIQLLAVAASDIADVDFAFVSTVDFDFGDLPLSYSLTTLSHDGARHIIPPGGALVYLGAPPDADINGVPTALATGDDFIGTDDEGGVAPKTPAAWTEGAAGSGNGGAIDVNVTGSGWLTGWIDWNHDGDFLDPGEFVANQAVTTGAFVINFDIPSGTLGSGASSRSWLSRFRVFPSAPPYPLFSYSGEAAGGEVEDLLIERPVGSSIGDLVWVDTNNNGARDAGEEGMGGLDIELRNSGGALIAVQATGGGTVDVDGDGVIDPAGYYRFRGLGAGTFTVTVTALPGGYVPGYDEDGAGTPSAASVTLAAAEAQHLTADFGYHPLLAAISGEVRYDADANGDLADSDAGAAFVKVQLWTDPDGDGNPDDGMQTGETFTDSAGAYAFPGMPTGQYVIVEINPVGALSTRDTFGVNDDRILVVLSGIDSAGNDFLDTMPPLHSISGTVYEDNDSTNDDIIGADDIALPFVVVGLYWDRDGSGDLSAGDPFLDTGITNGAGAFSFTALVDGNYVVVETDPPGAISDFDVSGLPADNQIAVTLTGADISGRDFLDDGMSLGTLGGTIWSDTNSNGIREAGELAIAGVTVFLDIDGNRARGADEPLRVTNSTGAYLFTSLPAAIWTARVDPLSLPAGVTPTYDPDGIATANQAAVVLAAGENRSDVDFGYRAPKPLNWAGFISGAQLTGADALPLANPDGDIYPNILEYAFCLPPRSGRPLTPNGDPCFCVLETLSGTLDAKITRPIGAAGLTYTLEFASELGNPTVWSNSDDLDAGTTDNGNGTETVTWTNLEQLAELSNGHGYLRVKVTLDSDGDNIPDATAATYVMGWLDHEINTQCETYCNPFLRKELFSGTGDAGSPLNAINVSGSALATDVAALMAGRSCLFVEVIGGPLEGSRFGIDAAASDADTIALDPVSPLNTRSPIPGLSGAPFVVREAWRVRDLFPDSVFQSGNDVFSSDNLLTFNSATQTWSTYFLADLGGPGIRWVDPADGSPLPADQGGNCVNPGQGLFVHRRGDPLIVPLIGVVRENAFASPLPLGYALVAGGYPLDQSYAGRAMTLANGFDGDVDIRFADQVLFWAGDTTPGLTSYNSHYLLDAGAPWQRWVSADDSFVSPQDNNNVFRAGRAPFIRRRAVLPGYVMPVPWRQ